MDSGINSASNLGAGTANQTPIHSDNLGSQTGLTSTQIKMKKLGKKLLGNKKAGKLFRLGLQQLAANQPEYFLVVSKKFIRQGQYSKSFNLLRKQVDKENIDIEYQPIILHHYMHSCHKILNKLIKNKQKELQEKQEQQERDPFSTLPEKMPSSSRKKQQFSRLEKLGSIFDIQFQNLQKYEELICDIIQNYETYSQQKGKTFQKLEPHQRSSFNTNFGNSQGGSIEDFSPETPAAGGHKSQYNQSSYNQSMYNNENQNGTDEANPLGGVNQKTEQSKKQFDIYKIEAFKEHYLQYFLKTILLAYRHYKQEDNLKIALKFIQKGYDFIMGFIDSLFGDFISLEIYSLSGDIIQIKADFYFESQNVTQAQKLYEKAWIYYRFAGQILLKKFQSKSIEDVDSVMELKCESIYSRLSINTLMQALCYENQFKFERMIESLQVSDWINTKILVYEFSDKLRNHVAELWTEAKAKYGTFLEEKGEIRRVLLQAFPDLELLEQKQSEKDSQQDMMNRIDGYLYEKGDYKTLNQTQFIIKKQRVPSSYQQDGQQQLTSNDNFDQIGAFTSIGSGGAGQEYIQSGNNISNRTISQMGIMTSPERAKDVGSQSFTDMYNMNIQSNTNNSTAIGFGSNTANMSSTYVHPSQMSSQQNAAVRRLPSGNMSSAYLSHSPRLHSNQSLFHNTTNGGFNQNSKNGLSLQQINEKDSVADYGLNLASKRHSNIHVSTRDTPQNNDRASFRITQTQSTKNLNDKGKGFFQSPHASGFNQQKRHSSGNLVIRSTKNTHEQPAPLYLKEHTDQFKPKVLTTNKYFIPETYVSTTTKEHKDFNETEYQEQEKRFHYLNLLPVKQKLEKNQGVLSLDFAMENLIKGKIIESEVKSIQKSLRHQQTVQHSYYNNGANGGVITPFSSKVTSNHLQPTNQLNPPSRLSTNENQQGRPSNVIFDLQPQTITPKSTTNLIAETNNQQYASIGGNMEQDNIEAFCDKTVGQQIKLLLTNLNITPEDQILIIHDLQEKFESEKRSMYKSKANQSKVSQQGWTTDKILEELLKMGENVNTYNLRFYQFLQTVKDEDFDKSEFSICLRKLHFRQRMGNGNIPQFFNERELPLARIQERRKIDDEYVVIQSGGERMMELMSDHKIIKNLFLEDPNANDGQGNAKANTKENQQGQEPNTQVNLDANKAAKQVQYSTAVSIIGKNAQNSKIFENKNSEEILKMDSNLKPTYKQKKRKITPGKTTTLQDLLLFNSSESNVEKLSGMNPNNRAQKVDYFQKSQELLRQMVLKSEQDYEDMQKEIMHPRKQTINSHRSKNLTFSNFTNKLAFSTSKYNQKEKIKKAGNKLDLIDFMRIQNKWRNKANIEKTGTIISTGTSEGAADSPGSALTQKFKKASRNFILANAMNSNPTSIFSKNSAVISQN